MTALRLQILGPLRLWRDDVEVDAGPRQQALLLSLLLARAGRPVSTNELVDLLWEEQAPASAINVIHKYVGGLRRLLEPALSTRGTGSFLHRRGNGYLFTPTACTLDVLTFRELVEAARREAALDSYVEALTLWRGPAGDGLGARPAARAVFAALDGEFLNGCTAAAELALSLGRPAAVLPALRRAASMAPLHEPVQATLIDALGSAGQRAEALAVFGAVRARLADELGIDPGRAMREAHRRALAGERPVGADARGQARPPGGLVGRSDELAALRETVAPALSGGSGLGVVEGEPGVGKSRLVGEAAAEAGRRGALVLLGACPEGDGTPSMWPWIQTIGRLLDSLPATDRETWLAGGLGRLLRPGEDVPPEAVLPDGGAQFRLFEQIVAVIAQASRRRPTMLIIDDLQWNDVASLHLFSHLAARLPAGVALLGVLRDRGPAPGPDLSRTLAAVSRMPGHRRIHLGPLGPDDVAELVRRETGREPAGDEVRRLHARTGGNPFFVRELARWPAARPGVPSAVRDVVRDRMADLDEPVRDLLRIAALIGRDVSLGLLAAAAGLEPGECLERLEPLEALGLLEFSPDDPFAFHFAHDIVRESVSETAPSRQAGWWHLAVADALEHTDPGGEPVAERLAHHLWAAGPLADPVRTTHALMRAAAHATAKSALEAAEGWLRSAVDVARKAGRAELELSVLAQLTTVIGMRSTYGTVVLDLVERAEHLAAALGRQREAADFLFSRWAAHAQRIELDRGGPLARRLLEQGEASTDPILREYGINAWGIHQWAIGNIGEAYRYLSRSNPSLARRAEDPLRHDLQLLSGAMLAETTALHGDVGAARAMIDALEVDAGDDPYVVTVWAAFATRIAVQAGDPAWVLRAVERGLAADPGFSFQILGAYQRLARWWALAVTGHDPAGAAAETERMITTILLDPPLSCVSTWYGLLGEMLLAAGEPEKALAALDRAGECFDAYGQRYAEGLILLLRARALAAAGEPVEVVRAAALRARSFSAERGAHLFARRADDYLATLS
ncbi:AAA family ATPase [Paractinoplanes atraurantiacus]|uniref:Transcriptional regulatory protein, C terminal n=1 Tax=Paractinoplanes atraurantiacus TaxID=1036182 RepID=A0A285GUG2_9ACTN|nr:AAA family ATPase [Actinoplanes atraurantiacus]SNY25941.1 Transcriptional regulatory protein, C terminal [Actinoplanes atraurantiacus]